MLPEGKRLVRAEHPRRDLLDIVVEEGRAHGVGQVLEVLVPRDDGVGLRQAGGQIGGQAGRQVGRQVGRQAGRQVGRQAGR